MTSDNFPEAPLTVSQQAAFDEEAASFEQRVFPEHLKKAGAVALYFLILLPVAGYFTSLAGEKLNFWNGLRALMADVLLALPPWIYLMAHLADGGYRRDEKNCTDHFNFRYVCSPESLSSGLGVSLAGWKKRIAQAISKQETFFMGLLVLGVSIAFFIGFMSAGALAWFFLALPVAAISVWNLLGWLVWFKPVETMREYYRRAAAPENTYLKGSRLVEMPAAACASPVAPPSPIPPGDFLDGNVTLNPDGSYKVGGMMTLDQGTTCEETQVMGVRITKKEAGEGKEILFEAEEKELRVEFSKGQWYRL